MCLSCFRSCNTLTTRVPFCAEFFKLAKRRVAYWTEVADDAYLDVDNSELDVVGGFDHMCRGYERVLANGSKLNELDISTLKKPKSPGFEACKKLAETFDELEEATERFKLSLAEAKELARRQQKRRRCEEAALEVLRDLEDPVVIVDPERTAAKIARLEVEDSAMDVDEDGLLGGQDLYTE